MKTRYLLLTTFVILGLAVLSYRVTYALFADSASSISNTFSAASSFPPISPPVETVDLKINEFMPRPSSGNEWVEIFNNGTGAVDLSGWKITDSNTSTSDDISLSGTINPGSFIAFDNFDLGGWLNNTGDIISLLRPDASVAETHTFGATISNISIGKDVDGTGTFKNCTTATKGSSNNLTC